MKQTDNYLIKYEIHLAKQALMKARIHRQLATIAKEMAMKEGYNDFLLREARELYREAKALRKEARDILLAVERSNGQRFQEGSLLFPLKHFLAGKFFKAWDEFDAEYAKIGAPLYGSDPE